MSKYDNLLMKAIRKDEESIILERDLFFKRFSEYVEKTFDGNLNYTMKLMTKQSGYALGNGLNFEYYEIGSKSTNGKLESYIDEWLGAMDDKFPFLVEVHTYIIKASSIQGLSREAVKERSAKWEFETRNMIEIGLSKEYVENLKKKVHGEYEEQVASTDETPGKQEDVIVDQFPCGSCEESSDERVMMHCSKGKYHATLCVKCYENVKATCTICGAIPNRLKCKVITLR